ncbi:serine--tRNA ligase [candidate division NPL-UPA2 bacterium]|nr:serine--tRNA ligase [candidate division NPL-UPA2 bacterium]
MLDLKFIRENPEEVKKTLKDRGMDADVDGLLKLDKERRNLLRKAEDLKHKKNIASSQIGKLISQGEEPKHKMAEMKAIAQKIKDIDKQVGEIDAKTTRIALLIPNIPHDSVPVGSDPEDNIETRRWGERPTFDFQPLSHWDIADALGIIDFRAASKISGRGFALYRGLGAKLERALINFMLDIHTTKHGYTEVFPPFMVKRECMVGTGQLPRLEEDMYRCEADDLFLIPTAEVPITNIHRGEILRAEDLPIYYCGYTACFRREAGSYGKETKGLVRVHQFDKIELVKFVKPETSYEELESLVRDAEEILQQLGLHYRVVNLCTADISFASTKCYDLEVWAPGKERYLEVSSCSNFSDFQARRAGIRYRPEKGGKAEYVHTLNGSGIALARTVVALLETYQEKDGRVTIPEALRPYMGGLDRIDRTR